MEIALRLSLPHDEMSVPMVRAICAQALTSLGVRAECIDDIEVALTEACTNVLDHAAATDAYAVDVNIGDVACVIEVVDDGGGFDEPPSHSDDAGTTATAETGRGIQIMQALVDHVQFATAQGNGTVCRLEKRLEWKDDAPARRLGRSGRPGGS